MIRKKFLFANDFYFDDNPAVLASLIGPGHLCAAFFDASREIGGMAVFPADEVDCGALLDDEAVNPRLEETLEKLIDAGASFSSLEVNLLGTEYDETALQPGKLEYTLKRLTDQLHSAGIQSVSVRVEQFPGMKIYFKTWDNSIRVSRTEMPAYCLSDSEKENRPDITRLLIVDDSSLVVNILSRTLQKDESIQIIGTASDVFGATEQVLMKDPDVLLLDIIMPEINGLNYLQELMACYPKPVVIFSTLGKNGGNVQQQAMELGAVDVMDKRKLSLNDKDSIEQIIAKIKNAGTVSSGN